MRRYLFLGSVLIVLLAWFADTRCQAQSAPTKTITPLRVVIVGLVHGHVEGFFQQLLHNPQIEIVGIVEPDAQLASKYAAQYGFDRRLLSSNLEEMLTRARPQAVLVYTNTYDHRRVVEVCAHHGVHVMMEKPLAVSLEDALAIEKAAQLGRIQVLVNYELVATASPVIIYLFVLKDDERSDLLSPQRIC